MAVVSVSACVAVATAPRKANAIAVDAIAAATRLIMGTFIVWLLAYLEYQGHTLQGLTDILPQLQLKPKG